MRSAHTRFAPLSSLLLLIIFTTAAQAAPVPPPVRIIVTPTRLHQEFQALGCGAMFYEGHITSLAARQKELYDDMFAKFPTQYLNLMIRPDHEPQNDNVDPYTLAFDPANFKYCQHTIAIAKAAKERQPDIEFIATLLTPPAWMKTNNAEAGGGQTKATLKPKLELEFAEFIYAFLAHMSASGVNIKYVSIANECDWPHDQPGCFFTPEAYADLFNTVGQYFEKMSAKNPDLPRPLMIGPNTLSAPGAVKSYLLILQRKAGKYLAVLAAHDYDPGGDRWGDMRRFAGKRPVWMTEGCARDADTSPGQINSATLYAKSMHEAFTGGANVWLAYDWAYPPAKGGEALIHIDWGNNYTLTKPYWLFRQWAAPFKPGMHIAESTATGPNSASIKPTAFLAADARSLVIHIVNLSDTDSAIQINIPAAKTPAARTRTSATEDALKLPAITGPNYSDTLPARSHQAQKHPTHLLPFPRRQSTCRKKSRNVPLFQTPELPDPNTSNTRFRSIPRHLPPSTTATNFRSKRTNRDFDSKRPLNHRRRKTNSQHPVLRFSLVPVPPLL